MANVKEISDQVMHFLANEISLDAFDDWSAEYSWNIHQRANKEVQQLAYEIRGILNAHADDETEDRLRAELAGAIFPFLESENRVGDSDDSSVPLVQANIETNEATAVSA